MDRKIFVKKFANRLNDRLRVNGHVTTRAKGCGDIAKLAEVAEVSYQMARKYILGLALPDIHIIPKIATWLNVPSSWLLYGEESPQLPDHKSQSYIEINIDILKYILTKSTVLFPSTPEQNKIANFIFGIIYDAAHIQANKKTLIQVIDMMLSHALQFSEIEINRRA